MQESVEQTVAGVLDPGENILWSGRPNVEAAMGQYTRRLGRNRLLGFISVIVVIIATVLILQNIGIQSLREALPFEPVFLWALALPFLLPVLAHLFKLDGRSRLERHFRSLTYAITDRRLLVLCGNKLQTVKAGRVASYTPEQMHNLQVRERAPGFEDVIFAQYSIGGGDTRDLLGLEKRFVGFKALPNAREIRQVIEEWRSSYVKEAACEVADFVDAGSSSSHIENQVLGLKLSAPKQWKYRARLKKKPYGKFFFDVEKWIDATQSDDWNVVKIEGPSHCMIEIEVFDTKPTVTFEQVANSGMADAVSGKVSESDADYKMSGMRGFSVTRQNDVQIDPETNSAVIGGAMILERLIAIHDERRQIIITSTWPEESADLKRAVDAVVESIEFSRTR